MKSARILNSHRTLTSSNVLTDLSNGLRPEFAFWAGAGAGVNNLGLSRSRRRSQQQGLCMSQSKFLRDLISVMMLVVEQSGINWDLFSNQCCHITQKWDTGWEHRAFHHWWWFQSYGLCKIQCVVMVMVYCFVWLSQQAEAP